MSKEKTTDNVVHVLGFYRPHDPNLGALSFEGQKSLTHQSFKDECDINVLMKRYEKTGILEHANQHRGQYGDFADLTNFQEALQIVREAETMFMTLPSRIRADFENDPGKFVSFAQNPDNADKLVEYGLATKREPESPPASAAAPAAAPVSDGKPPPGA